MSRRMILWLAAMLIACTLSGCSSVQEDMGISLENFIQDYNLHAEDTGAPNLSMEDYHKNDGEENGSLRRTLPNGTNLYIAVTAKGNVASIQLYLPPESIQDDTMLELGSTALACIHTLDEELCTDIISATGLGDMGKSAKTLQENQDAYFLYFYDTNSKGLDTVHGKQYRLWYNNGLKYTIMYPLQE